ncbi:MAG: putative rane protein [Lachnospiraceae bacterium]|nr:putative rane protein [Lachnospiraceae bacterium]
MEKKSITRDMTSGSPARIILKFSVPMLIGNLFQQFYNMVDSIVVGKFVGSDALAAVGATGSLVFLIIGLTFGLSAGISIVIAQYFGAKDYESVRKGFATATYIVVGVSIIMGVVGFFSSHWLLELLNTPASINSLNIFSSCQFT